MIGSDKPIYLSLIVVCAAACGAAPDGSAPLGEETRAIAAPITVHSQPLGASGQVGPCSPAHVVSKHGRLTGAPATVVPVLWGPNVAKETVANIVSSLETMLFSPWMKA